MSVSPMVVVQSSDHQTLLTLFEKENIMRRLLMIVGLLLTLSNAGLGIAYAASCEDNLGGGCSGSVVWKDAAGKCHCTDDLPIEGSNS